MKSLNNIKKLTLGFTAAVAISGVVGVSGAMAWGPERETFTMENPATYPVFNSITNNPTIGDERNFVRIGEVNTAVTDLTDEVEIVPGKQYLVYIYFHNNASSIYNDSAHNNSGIASGTRMSSSFPTVLTAGEKKTVTATITANNTNPLSVWDESYISTASDKVYLRYVLGSAKIYNDFATNGSVLSDNLFTEAGTLIGLTSLNGAIPGCEEYHGVVSYVLQAEALTASIDKVVSKDGENFVEGVEINPGEEVTFKLTVKNTGDRSLTNAILKDSLPAGLSLVPGSVQLWANESNTKETVSDDIIGNGINLGTIGTENVVYITYRAKAAASFNCEGIHMVNTASLTYDSDISAGDSVEDTAKVDIIKEDCDDCTNHPELPECNKIPETGPVEIVMAIVVILGIGGGGYYLYRTRKTLKTVEDTVAGKDAAEKSEDVSSQKPDNMVK